MTGADTAGVTAAAEQSAPESMRTWVLVAVVAFLVSLVAYAGFTTTGGTWFTISDAPGVFLAGPMIPGRQ